jgi:hypothetical protein
MRRLHTFGLTLAATAGLAAPAAAQTGAPGGTVTSLPGVGVVSNTATGTGTSGVTGTPGGITNGGIQTATSTLGDPTLSATPQIGALAGPGVVPQALSPSNILGGYYANAYYQGVPSATARAPGGVGVPRFGTAGLTGGGIIGTQTSLNSGLNSGLVGAATARPGATGRGGQQGTTGQLGGATNSQSAVVIPLPRQISYTATLNFRAPVATMPEVATGLRTTLSESSMLTNPAGIGLAMDGATVVLSGTVPTDDEARLVEGMVRLTPGVRDVRNELKVSPPSP